MNFGKKLLIGLGVVYLIAWPGRELYDHFIKNAFEPQKSIQETTRAEDIFMKVNPNFQVKQKYTVHNEIIPNDFVIYEKGLKLAEVNVEKPYMGLNGESFKARLELAYIYPDGIKKKPVLLNVKRDNYGTRKLTIDHACYMDSYNNFSSFIYREDMTPELVRKYGNLLFQTSAEIYVVMRELERVQGELEKVPAVKNQKLDHVLRL